MKTQMMKIIDELSYPEIDKPLTVKKYYESLPHVNTDCAQSCSNNSRHFFHVTAEFSAIFFDP